MFQFISASFQSNISIVHTFHCNNIATTKILIKTYILKTNNIFVLIKINNSLK